MISKNHVKHIQTLHSKKHRDEHSIFIIVGIKIVTEFINSDAYQIVEVLGLDSFISINIELLESKNIPFSEITEDELKKISTQQGPNKVLAIVKMQNSELQSQNKLLDTCLYLDDIRDPGNLGTIIRIADWFGINKIFCSKQSTELYNPKTLQATMGAILRVNVEYIDFENLLLKNQNLPVYGAVLNGKNIYKNELQKGIIVIGNEANGISEAILKQITLPITIPSASLNGSESLNAANACAIICSEFNRQLNYK